LVIDSSALLAIVFDERERPAFVDIIESAPRRLISAATLLECSLVVLKRTGETGVLWLDEFLKRAGIDIASVDADQSRAAIDAYRRFGKGRHPAGLNFGDCFAYALAAVTSEPLLYKGDDFAKTDIAAA
jgi:ribonuclease VapC